MYYVCTNMIKDGDNLVADEVVNMNCSRDLGFIQLCLLIIKQTKINKTNIYSYSHKLFFISI